MICCDWSLSVYLSLKGLFEVPLMLLICCFVSFIARDLVVWELLVWIMVRPLLFSQGMDAIWFFAVMLFVCTAGSKQRSVVVLVAEHCCCNRFYFADPGILVLAAMLCLCWIQDLSLARARLVDSQIPCPLV
jgi:hypothetical protein